uniref:Uncharacterized protein n=1 Tax=Fagus sylvatica TaxID=28930 RepID=A0A2N9J7Q7_FAGSY
MSRITTTGAWLFGFLSVILKLLGISETVFEVTQKDQSSDDVNDAEVGRFTFNESPTFLARYNHFTSTLDRVGCGLVKVATTNSRWTRVRARGGHV